MLPPMYPFGVDNMEESVRIAAPGVQDGVLLHMFDFMLLRN